MYYCGVPSQIFPALPRDWRRSVRSFTIISEKSGWFSGAWNFCLRERSPDNVIDNVVPQRSSMSSLTHRLVPPSLRNGSGEACIDLGPALTRRQLLPIRCREQDRKLPQALRTTNQLSEDCAQPPTWPCWLGPLHAR